MVETGTSLIVRKKGISKSINQIALRREIMAMHRSIVLLRVRKLVDRCVTVKWYITVTEISKTITQAICKL